jgi:mRNA-degrading endonuclease YafQ of YafQ-DinJ toxin-antitoxin module
VSLRVVALRRTERFERAFKRLEPQTQNLVKRCLQGLLEHPIPARLRHHTLGGHRPAIHVIDVSGNHAWQVTFRCEGEVATLLRVAPHRHIDRDPGT